MGSSLFNCGDHLGEQRIWYWRGWRVRYTHVVGSATHSDSSDNPPFLLLHGAGSSLEQWRENLLELARDRPVYALDLVGFGGSEKIAHTVNTALWTQQVADFWETFLGRPMILTGHSLGALVALQTATTYPNQVDRLVMLTLPAARQELGGSASRIGAAVERWFASPLLIRPLFHLIRQPWLIRLALRAIAQRPHKVDSGLVEGFLRPTRDRGAARMFCYLVKSRTSDSFSPLTQEMVEKVQVPTLLLWGKCDRVIPIDWGRYVNTLNDRLCLVEIEDAGHFFYDELALEFHDIVEQWLC
ncbi:hydrolase, alpha/beta fold family, putative [Synechococcus sp. PCC 7335]|uniref:alpha/beta fold hydrolase n=1 Tax=Synechococcus sp. (strain ATCC 29403 / PCC 7335) TaxID=91464 RepID=UPI00017EE7FC|nr:alpha/beta fold hydrolase [Synechococcus sp. PCC 7335]EDX85137.1 hydrolase, alpha/beta fold family, putative [Synechococcus sp. PCC 7335]